jgi:nucleoside-diphosphate-sugar epimerase
MPSALVVGGTGPTGPGIVLGLLELGYTVEILHTGRHETDLPAEVGHIHTDPNFLETLRPAVEDRRFDVVLGMYGRLRIFPDAMLGVTDRLITVGGATFHERDSRPAHESSPRVTGLTFFERMLEAEKAIFDAHVRGDYQITHLRYPAVYGPRQQWPTEWSVMRRILDGRRRIPVVDGGLPLLARVYAENAVDAILLAVKHPDRASGQSYNVADLFGGSDADRVRAIAKCLSVDDLELVSVPSSLRMPSYYPGVSRGIRNPGSAAPWAEHELIDSSKIRRELGHVDRVDFDTAIERTVAWYLANSPEPGGEIERHLGDPFDYELEDRFLASLDTALGQVDMKALNVPSRYTHPYDHPKQPVPLDQPS